jgi:4'-phosphopantetheinyl transferase
MSSQWNLIGEIPPLGADEVQIWRIGMDDAAGWIDHYTSFLNAEEQARASRHRAGQVRDHFIIGRACLRVLLENALKIDANNIEFAEGVHGKPEIASIEDHDIAFNVAHSQNTVLIALGRQGSLGVDVEYFDRATDVMEVAQANFTQNESDALAAIADHEARLRTFYRYWTRKEAVGKADGRGLLLPLASFDVSFRSMESQPVHIDGPSHKERKSYFVSDLDLGEKAAAAVALESSPSHINKMVFPLRLHRVAAAGQ